MTATNAALRRSTRAQSSSVRSLSTAGSTGDRPRSLSELQFLDGTQRKRSRAPISTTKSADGKRPPKKIRKEENIKDEQKTKDETKIQEENPPSHSKSTSPTANDSKKWTNWSAHSKSSPFPHFIHPTPQECLTAFHALKFLHQADVEKEMADPDMPETIPNVLEAVIFAILSQATSWSNQKRAINGLKSTYGSVSAYEKIVSGGKEKLQEAIRPGGLHVRKALIITTLLEQVHARYGKYDLDHLHSVSDEDAMKELLSYKYMGPKSASVVMSWSLQRKTCTVDVHVWRIAGLWGWRPAKASKELTQAHLFARVPGEMQLEMHFLLIAHGRTCPACKGGAKEGEECTVNRVIRRREKEES